MENIGRYKILEEIGKGAMAVVYRAHDPNIDRILAIKILREENCVDTEYRVRFLREAKAAGNLSHPNIVTIYDVGEYKDRPYIVMELLEGQPLDELMKTGNEFDWDSILSIGRQLASALHYAHSNGVIHRDIKPSNIICSTNDNSQPQIKITDFGIARIEDSSITQHTQIGEVLGTPQYMSPEQALGQEIDGRSDLFSVGVILYQLFSGQKPFKGTTIATLLFQIATVDPVPINQIVPNFPIILRNIIDKLLKKQPDKRYQNGLELEVAIKRAIRHFREKQLHKEEPRIIPLHIKWTVVMGFIVAVAMITSISIIYTKQKQSMSNQMVDFGVSLAQVIATQSWEPILSEDWVSIELFAQEISESQEFSFLSITDHQGKVLGHSDKQKLGTKSAKLNDDDLITEIDGTKVYEHVVGNADTYDFVTPIEFNSVEIGQIHLGLSKSSLEQATEVTLYTMMLLSVIVITAVSALTYILSYRMSSPINILKQAIDEITTGHFTHRIQYKRNDEFGQLFSKFDNMAESLQTKDEHLPTLHN